MNKLKQVLWDEQIKAGTYTAKEPTTCQQTTQVN